MKSPSALKRLSSYCIGTFEYIFYQHGKAVCRHPFIYISTVLAITAACGVGLLNFQQENQPFKLWIPQDSDFVSTFDWMQDNFPREHRFENAILTADNVLEPDVLLEMLRVHDLVVAPPSEGPSWQDVCERLPSLASEEEDEEAARREAEMLAFADQLSSEPEDVTSNPEDVTSNPEAVTSNPEGVKPDSEDVTPDTEVVTSLVRRKRQAMRRANADFDLSAFDFMDPSVSLSTSIHCMLLDSMTKPCWESSLLELWSFKPSRLRSLTKQDILNRINTVRESPVFGYRFNISHYLGDIQRNSSGHVIGARAAFMTWTVKRKTDVPESDMMNDAGTGEPVDRETVMFENHFLSAFSSAPALPGVSWYYSAGKSFGEISNSTIFGDVKYLVLGYIIMFMYIQMMLGRCNLVEHRSYLSMLGVFSVCLAVVISFGLCSALGVFFGPVHNILPLLLLGLGVDDMFVILQCWETLSADEKTKSLEERVGRAIQHAGVSITVTSVTDIVAFGIGSSTVLPALDSFCIYASLGIAAVYFIQATWFVAWFTLDQRRIEARRDGVVPCIKHRRWAPNKWSQKNYFQQLFSEWLAPAILSNVGKAVVLLVTAALVAVNSWGLSQLRQEFNPLWFIPSDSYLSQYHRTAEHYFPNKGAEGIVFLSGVDFESNLPQMAELSRRLRADPNIQSVESWYDEFQYYINYNEYGELPERFYDGYEFLPMLGQFMFSPRGGKFRNFIKFNGSLECGSAAPPMNMAMISYTHTLMNGPKQQIPAMLRVKSDIKAINFTGPEPFVEPMSEAYAVWETDQVLEHELYRNMGLALLCVFVMVLLLIADLAVSLLVLCCVFLTLVDLGGLMFFWGLTIDTVSCIDVVLAIGLCVDYAAHVGHTFLTQRGTRNQRAAQTLSDIGPAVFNGGFSTFLAFIFLATSTSHVFITFFKVFFGVSVFGLWHGLVTLPVLLSLVGPDPYLPSHDKTAIPPRAPPPKITASTNGYSKPNGDAAPGKSDKDLESQTDIPAGVELITSVAPLASPEHV